MILTLLYAFSFRFLTGCIHSCYRKDLNWNSIHLPVFLRSVIIMESLNAALKAKRNTNFLQQFPSSRSLYTCFCVGGTIVFCSDEAYMMLIELLIEMWGWIIPALYQFLSLCGFERLVICYHKKEMASAMLGTAEMQNAALFLCKY